MLLAIENVLQAVTASFESLLARCPWWKRAASERGDHALTSQGSFVTVDQSTGLDHIQDKTD